MDVDHARPAPAIGGGPTGRCRRRRSHARQHDGRWSPKLATGRTHRRRGRGLHRDGRRPGGRPRSSGPPHSKARAPSQRRSSGGRHPVRRPEGSAPRRPREITTRRADTDVADVHLDPVDKPAPAIRNRQSSSCESGGKRVWTRAGIEVSSRRSGSTMRFYAVTPPGMIRKAGQPQHPSLLMPLPAGGHRSGTKRVRPAASRAVRGTATD